MSFELKFNISPNYIAPSTRRRSGLLVAPSVKFIVAHDTGNPGSTAAANVSYYKRTADKISASAHLFVDDKEIIECVPALTKAPERAWHVRYSVPTDNRLYGFEANDAAIGIEYCWGGSINADSAYEKYVWLLAYCCYKFELDPATSIVGHFFLDPGRRTDPVTGLANSRRTYNQLLSDVVEEYKRCTGTLPPPEYDFHEEKGSAKVIFRLNIRKGEPTTKVPVSQVVDVNTKLDYVGWVSDGQRVNGNSKWYKLANGDYCWSGGVVEEKDLADRLEDMAEGAIVAASGILWGIGKLNISALHEKNLKGSGMRIAVLDSGIDKDHPDLKSALGVAVDTTSSPSGAKDVLGHGTHVSGIVAARKVLTNFTGVAPDGLVNMYKVRHDLFGIRETYLSDALKKAVPDNDIINLSLHFYRVSATLEALVRNAVSEGKIVIAATEIRSNGEISFPASLPESISVGSAQLSGNAILVSPDSIPYIDNVDIIAPGDKIHSTSPDSGYETLSGSSMAAAFVTGVIALIAGELKLRGQTIGPEEMRMALIETASDVKDKMGNVYKSKLINPAKLANKLLKLPV